MKQGELRRKAIWRRSVAQEEQEWRWKGQVLTAVVTAAVTVILTLSFQRGIDYFSQPPLVTDILPEEMIALFCALPGNMVRAEEIARKVYYGKYIAWTGTIEEIEPVPSTHRVTWHIDTQRPDCPPVQISAAFKNEQDVLRLNKGDRVALRCRIAFSSWTFPEPSISLDKCSRKI